MSYGIKTVTNLKFALGLKNNFNLFLVSKTKIKLKEGDKTSYTLVVNVKRYKNKILKKCLFLL